MPLKNIMLDIETFGTAPYSVILSLGAAWFDPTKLGTEAIKTTFYACISPDDQPARGLRMDVDTVCWWMLPAQRPAYDEWHKTPHVVLDDALRGFGEWLLSLDNVEPYADRENFTKEILMWGNGPQFDNELVRHAYKVCNLPPPWGDPDTNPTSNDRCFRTLKNLPGARDLAPPHEGNQHHALIDARQQAMWLCAINQANGLGLK